MHCYFGDEEYPRYRASHDYSPIQLKQDNGHILIQGMGDEAAEYLLMHHIHRVAPERFLDRAQKNTTMRNLLERKGRAPVFSVWEQGLSEVRITNDLLLYVINDYIPKRDLVLDLDQDAFHHWEKNPELEIKVADKLDKHISEFLSFVSPDSPTPSLSIQPLSPYRIQETKYKASSSMPRNKTDMAFSFYFTANVSLPPYLCLGTRKRYGHGKTTISCP